MSSFTCNACHTPIHENSALMARGGRVYHQRCAPSGKPEASIPYKIGAVLWLSAPGCGLFLLLLCLFPIPMIALVISGAITWGWLSVALKIRRKLR